jgi:sugar lactone lactonase YvrE
MTPEGKEVIALATVGRPLGLKYGPDGKLYVCDAKLGLLAVGADGKVEKLANSEGGVAFGVTNDLAIAASGAIYFSDASTRHPVERHVDDIFEHRASGRLLKYDPGTRKVTRLADGFSFANGVALGPNDEWLVLSETGSYRLWRVWLSGPKAGQKEIFVDALPGFPDNLTYSPERRVFWVALFAPRVALLDVLAPYPLLRKIASHFPLPKAERHAFVVSIDEAGRPVESLQWRSEASYSPVTSAVEREGYLYLGSVVRSGFQRVRLP